MCVCACVRARVCVEQLFEWIHRIQSAAEVRTRKSNATVKYSTKVPGGSARERERERKRERERIQAAAQCRNRWKTDEW